MFYKQTILDKIDYGAFYDGHIQSRSGSTQASGRCPFHEDQRPSFSVNLDTGLWKCHAGCGEGNAIDFYMKCNNVNFKTAIKELTQRVGVTGGKI